MNSLQNFKLVFLFLTYFANKTVWIVVEPFSTVNCTVVTVDRVADVVAESLVFAPEKNKISLFSIYNI